MTVGKSTERPEKPYPEYPLNAHASGQWRKRYKGKTYYCGPWSDPMGALREWERIRNELELGHDPTERPDGITIDVAVNLFLDAKDALVQSGDLSRASYNQYKLVCKWLKEQFGPHRLIQTIGPQDFVKLRAKFPADWSTTTVKNQIIVTRTIFKWCFNNELIDKPIRYGDNFSKPSQKRQNLERAAKHKKEFKAEEIWKLHKYADPTVRAWILLGLNAGYGNSDLSRLKVSDVSGAWLSVPRGKTGLDRKAWLWPETREAIKAVLKDHDGGDLLFLSETGQSLVSDDGTRDVVTRVFGRLKKDCGVDRKGVGFYSLRHVFETVAGETKDQIAVDHVMGHTDASIAKEYREWISDARIKAVCQHVRKWLLDGKPKRSKKRTRKMQGGAA